MLVNLFLLRQALLKRTGVLWHTSECFVVLFCFSFFSSRRLKAFISNIYYRKWKAPTSGSQYTVGPLRAGPSLEFLNLTAVCTEPREICQLQFLFSYPGPGSQGYFQSRDCYGKMDSCTMLGVAICTINSLFLWI